LNYPSAVSVFDIVPSRVSGKVITDALSSPTLTYTTDSSGYNSSTGTVKSTGVINIEKYNGKGNSTSFTGYN